jgi:hypothetical protein
MSRMAIPRWLAIWLLTFLTYRQRELLKAGLAGGLCCSASPASFIGCI